QHLHNGASDGRGRGTSCRRKICVLNGAEKLSSRYFSGYRKSPDPLQQFMPDADQLEFDGVVQVAIDPEKVTEADFALPVHQCMFRFWQKNRTGGDLPPTTAVNPLAFPEAVGHIHVVQPNADYSDFRYRLYATVVSEIGGIDMTGRWFSESPVVSWKFYRRQLAATAKLRTPIYSENNADYQTSVLIKWCRLLLPMADANGTVDRILVANVPVDRRNEA
ncbi:MAG: PAS domain-containing protein, partial [Alphaproteobacteria bacterium]|nr:PAS domain-containing protein [Alphaproteobacteria bacterium]